MLAAFELLLSESGGSLSDVYGDSLDLGAALAAGGGDGAIGGEGGTGIGGIGGGGTVGSGGGGRADGQRGTPSWLRRGVLAGPDVMVPYFTRATRTAFPSDELDGSQKARVNMGM